MKPQSTKTILDVQNEVKLAKLELNNVKTKIETIRRELGEYEAARSALKEEFESKIGVEDLKNAVLENIIKNRLQYQIAEHEKKISDLKIKIGKYEKIQSDALLENQRLHTENETLKSSIEHFNTEIKKSVETFNGTNKKNTAEIQRLSKSVAELRAQNKIEKEKHDAYQSEYLENTSFIMQEEIRLANKETDLHIYEARLRAKYLELWPEMEIVL